MYVGMYELLNIYPKITLKFAYIIDRYKFDILYVYRTKGVFYYLLYTICFQFHFFKFYLKL